MVLCKAYNIINKRGITPWMAYAILKWNDGYCIYNTQNIKKHPNLPYVYIRRGGEFPNPPINTIKK